MKPEKTIYGDLHFHTRYSDNHDRATVEQMICRGLDCGIGIFGTGDHNHNMTAESFRAQVEETAEVRHRYPELVIMNNVEMTFLLGHFHVFDPGSITGSIEEAYRFLYESHDKVMMANHPGLPSDEWNSRMVPTIAAIEVINGSVLTEAARRGARLTSIFDCPSVGSFAQYLRIGTAVAALGSSDAHVVSELGTGFTGFHFEGKPDVNAVLRAIRERKTFATTSVGIDMDWRLNESERCLSWAVAVPSCPKNANDAARFSVEMYNCSSLIERRELTSLAESGSIAVEEPGYYWLAVVSDRDFAVSSPVAFRAEEFRPARTDREIKVRAEKIAAGERSCISTTAGRIRSRKSVTVSTPVDVALLSTHPNPRLIDAVGRFVEFRRIGGGEARVVIEKECEPWRFGEFYLWLRRNQIHEYRFGCIDYRLDGSTFEFAASLVPYYSDKREGVDGIYGNQISEIKETVERCETVHIHVSVPPTLIVRIENSIAELPISVTPSVGGMMSIVAMPWKASEGPQDGFRQFFV